MSTHDYMLKRILYSCSFSVVNVTKLLSNAQNVVIISHSVYNKN